MSSGADVTCALKETLMDFLQSMDSNTLWANSVDDILFCVFFLFRLLQQFADDITSKLL